MMMAHAQRLPSPTTIPPVVCTFPVPSSFTPTPGRSNYSGVSISPRKNRGFKKDGERDERSVGI